MLGKLLKYEIKFTYKTFLALFLSVLALSGINKLFMIIGTYENSLFSFLSVLMIFAYVIITLSSFIISLVIIIQRFYKNLFSNEGYLSFTLPVKPYMHIISKCITAIIWIILNVITIAASLCILFSGDNHITSFFQDIFKYFDFLKLYIGSTTVITFVIEFILIAIMSLIFQTLFIYLSISIGNLFNKHKIFASFSAYIIIFILIQVVNSFILSFCLPGYSEQTAEITFLTSNLFPIVIASNIIFSLIFFFLTNFILTRHLNLE